MGDSTFTRVEKIIRGVTPRTIDDIPEAEGRDFADQKPEKPRDSTRAERLHGAILPSRRGGGD